ncbi:MAG: glycosyltransferase [Gaiellaceae bacterium]
MRNVLFLAYHFPPTGGAGVQRSAKFVRYLPALGYNPVVVTGGGVAAGRWTPHDASLLSEIPAEVQIHRLGVEPGESPRTRARAERWLRLRTPFARWWVEGAVAKGLEVGAETSLVYSSMSPFDSAEAAARLAGQLGLPWVADLRDPWALDEMFVYPSALHRRLELRRMRALLGSATAIVMNTPEAAAALLDSFPELRSKDVDVIPNGYDAADFDGADPARDDSLFSIVHTGYLHTELRRSSSRARRLLGGSLAGVDIGTRSHVYLLEGIRLALEARPDLRPVLAVKLAGVLSEHDRAAISSPLVEPLGYLPHDRTIELMRSADLLFLPMHELPPGRRARIVPGKTYEYLAAGRPILAALPDGDARDLLGACESASLCRPSDADAMARIIVEELDRFRRDGPAPSRRPEEIGQFERRRLSERLAAVFDRALGASAPERDAAYRSRGTGAG